MPYALLDDQGHVTKVSSTALPGAQSFAADHPLLLAFLEANGVPPTDVELAIKELRRTDNEMSRAIEDVITALLRKNVLRMTDLPRAVQDRIALRLKLRLQIQEAFDKASRISAPVNSVAAAG
jgi:hypothetical protein